MDNSNELMAKLVQVIAQPERLLEFREEIAGLICKRLEHQPTRI